MDSGESRTPWTLENSDLDSEVRHKVNLELTQQLRELRESLLQERETGLREWGQRSGNAWDKQVGEPVCFSTPVEPRTNNAPVCHPQEGQLVSSIGGSGCIQSMDLFPPKQVDNLPQFNMVVWRRQSQTYSRLPLSPGNRTVCFQTGYIANQRSMMVVQIGLTI